MVDKAKLDQMLANLARYREALDAIAALPRDRFLADQDKVGNAKYHLVIAIECCTGIANHVIASEGFRFPRDNADCFVVLVEAGVLGEAMREPLRATARFRNRLVHLYWDVDDERVHEYLVSSLVDIERFGEAIARREW